MKKIIVNGTFDLLHLGHIRLLEYAKNHVDSFVYVLIDSDKRVKSLKGQSRPIYNAHERAEMLISLKYVDKVDIFDTDQELIDFIKKYNPDLMIKGSDYRSGTIIGSEYCKKIEFYDRHQKYSTTDIIQDITNRR